MFTPPYLNIVENLQHQLKHAVHAMNPKKNYVGCNTSARKSMGKMSKRNNIKILSWLQEMFISAQNIDWKDV